MDCQIEHSQLEISDKTADIGLIYVNKHKEILPNIINNLQEKLIDTPIKVTCFKMNDLDIELNSITGILVDQDSMIEAVTHLPKVIYNMGYFTLTKNLKKLKKLRLKNDITLINPHNRFNQMMIFDMLFAFYKKDSILMPYSQFNQVNLYQYLETYKNIHLVPEKRSNRKHQLFIHRLNDGYTIHLNTIILNTNKENIYLDLIKITNGKKYILLGSIDEGMGYKITVYMQKTIDNQWVVSTNSIQKETAFKVIHLLESESLKLCQYIENYLYDIGCCTLEFMVDFLGEFKLFYIGGWDDHEFLLKDSFWPYFNTALDYAIWTSKKVINNEI